MEVISGWMLDCASASEPAGRLADALKQELAVQLAPGPRTRHLEARSTLAALPWVRSPPLLGICYIHPPSCHNSLDV